MTDDLIFKFCNVTGVSGDEGRTLNVAQDILSKYGQTCTDKNNNIISKVLSRDDSNKSLLLDAHIDQIGFIVTHVFKEGFIKVAPCGGIDPLIMIGSCVIVHGQNDILGVVCSMPPHLKNLINKNANFNVEDLCIDTGILDGSIESFIKIGDTVTFEPRCRRLLNRKISAVALDNRASVVSIIKSLEFIKDVFNKLNCSITVVFSSQEETTGKGCMTSSYSVNSQQAIVVDVSFASQPDVPDNKTGIMGKGPMIGISPVLDKEMTQKLISLAKKNDIPYQFEIMPGGTGTNADRISSSRSGIKTALLSIPLRYMHTAVETVDLSDIENTGKLISCYVKYLGGC